MSTLLRTIAIAILCLSIYTQSSAEGARPGVSEKPLAMMQALTVLEGSWNARTYITEDDGKSWVDLGSKKINVRNKHKGMLLAETPAEASTGGFEMDTAIAYDQYREVYRMAATDDTWGIMDIYEGTIRGDALVMTNLKSGTFFPIGEGVWRGFRLTMQLSEPTRTMVIDKTDDNGTSWQPAFRVEYSRTTSS